METLKIKEATNQEPPFYKGRKWMIPQSCFILVSLGKTYSSEEIAELKTKINIWSRRWDRYMVDITLSKTYGPEILILNETLLAKRYKRKLKKLASKRSTDVVKRSE